MSSSAPAAGAPAPSLAPASRSLVGLSLFARVAGAVVALGYLLGLVPGDVTAVIAAAALLSFGRGVAPQSTHSYLGLAAFGAIALAAAVGALRWATSSLDAIRGAQAVLGPTVLVEPQQAAIGSGLAAGAGILALSVWLAAHRPAGPVSFAVSCAEAVVVALLLATCFWGPAVVVGGPDAAELAKDVAAWVLVVLAATLPAVALSLLWRRLPVVWSWVAILVAIAAALAGIVLVPSFVTS